MNSRLDVSFGFERHFNWGLKKMEMRMGFALCVTLAMAVKHFDLDRIYIRPVLRELLDRTPVFEGGLGLKVA